MLGLHVIGIELQDHLAHGDRLHEESALHVTLDSAIVGRDRFIVLAKAAIHFGGALGPLRITRFETLELKIRIEGALVLPGGRCSGCLLSQLSRVFTSHSAANISPDGVSSERDRVQIRRISPTNFVGKPPRHEVGSTKC